MSDSTQRTESFQADENMEEPDRSLLGSPFINESMMKTPMSDSTQRTESFQADENMEEPDRSLLGSPFINESMMKTPMTDSTQRTESFQADENLVEVDQSVLDAPPKKKQRTESFQADENLVEVDQYVLGSPFINESMMKTTMTDSTQRTESFQADENLVEVDQSVLDAPPISESLLRTTMTDSTQRTESFQADENHVEVDQSLLGSPFINESMMKTPMTDSSQRTETFQADENLVEVDQSVLDAPPISESMMKTPMTGATQRTESFQADENLVEVDQSVLDAPPISESMMKTPMTDSTQRTESFQADENMEEPDRSLLGSPFINESMMKTPMTDSSQRTETFQADENLVEVDQSVLDAPPISESMMKTPMKGATQRTKSFQSGEVVITKDKFAEMNEKLKIYDDVVRQGYEVENAYRQLKEKTNILKKEIADLHNQCAAKDSEIFQVKDACDIETFELQEQLTVLREELRTTQSDIDGYKIVVEKYRNEVYDLKMTLTKERQQLTELKKQKDDEIESVKSNCEYHRSVNAAIQNVCTAAEAETKLYKTKALDAQKLVTDLEAEKESLSARVLELQRQKDDEVETLKAGFGDIAALKEKLSELEHQKNAEIEFLKLQIASSNAERDSLQEHLAGTNDQLIKANVDIEEYKAKAELAIKEICVLQGALGVEKESMNALRDSQNQKNAEIEFLKLQIASSNAERDSLQEHLAGTNDQLIKANVDIEEYKAKAELAIKEICVLQGALGVEKESMNALRDSQNQKNAEIESLKLQIASSNAERDSLQEHLAGTNDQLIKANVDIEEYQAKAELAIKEICVLQGALGVEKESMNALRDSQNQKNAEIESLKLQIASSYAERDSLQEQLAGTNDQLIKANVDIEEYKAKADELQNILKKERTSHQEEFALLNEKLLKANVVNENIHMKISQLHDDLDAAAVDKKELSETIFDLQAKLAKYGEKDDEIRGVINMAEFCAPGHSPSVAEELQLSSKFFEDGNDTTQTEPNLILAKKD